MVCVGCCQGSHVPVLPVVGVTFVDMAKVDSPIIQKSLAALQVLDPTLQILIVKMAQQSSLHRFFNVTNTSYLFYDHGTLMKKLLIEEPTIQDLMTFVGHSLECGFG